MILYLHGFRSGPRSVKARLLGEAMAARGLAGEFHCPALSVDPGRALGQAEAVIAGARNAGRVVTLVGSSLGGYYATWLAERYDLRAVLVNPAVLAHLSLAQFVGPQVPIYGGDPFDFTLAHVEALRALEVVHPMPARYLLLLERGDEVLDWRQAATRYAGCGQQIFDGGNHGFSRFSQLIPEILAFAGIAPVVPGALPAARL